MAHEINYSNKSSRDMLYQSHCSYKKKMMVAEGSQSVNIPLIIEGGGRRSKKRTGEQSLDTLDNFENKLTRVEVNVGEILEWKDTVDQLVGDISVTIDGMKQKISFIKEDVLTFINTFRNEFHEKVVVLEDEINVCMTTFTKGVLKRRSLTWKHPNRSIEVNVTLENLMNSFGLLQKKHFT